MIRVDLKHQLIVCYSMCYYQLIVTVLPKLNHTNVFDTFTQFY